MKKFLKLFAIVLAIFMVLAAFAACGKKNEEPEDNKPVDTNPVDDNPTDTPTHEHAWGEGKVTKEATCTEAGEKTYTCSCGETKTEAIPALGHTWNEGEVTKEATTEEAGEKTFTCTVCGETKVEAIEKLPVEPITAKPGDYVEIKDVKYVVNEDLTYTYLYSLKDKKTTTEIKIDATVDGVKVTAIADTAFSGWAKLEKVTIEEGIKSIGEYAFEDCVALAEIEIPDSVTKLGANAFLKCTGLRVVTLGDGLTTIPVSAFEQCTKITILDLGDGLTVLEPNTFRWSAMNLVKVTIGKSLTNLQNAGKTSTSFETAAKYGKLTVVINNSEAADADDLFGTTGPNVKAVAAAVEADAGKTYIEVDENGYVFYVKKNATPALVSYIGGGQQNPADETEAIDPAAKILVLPTTFGEFKEEYTIYKYAFNARTDVKSIILSDGVVGIDEYAFAEAAITALTIPKNVATIGVGITAYCQDLKTLTVADGNTVFAAAGNCVYTIATKTLVVACPVSVIPTDGSVTRIGANTFEGFEDLTAIAIPVDVIEIGDEAFIECVGLATINFAGTKAQWTAITKGDYWDTDMPNTYVVVCSNGKVCKTHVDANSDNECDVCGADLTT